MEEKNTNLNFIKDSAGKIMTENVPVANLDDSIADIEKLIVKGTIGFDTINYIYIVDTRNHLKGVISIKELYRQKKDIIVRKVMNKELVLARPSTDQERIVYKALKNSIKAVPIVDKNGKFLGVVQNDDILTTLYEETQEDIFQLAGVNKPRGGFDNIMELPILESLKHRFPWLFVGLLGGMFIAKIIGFFEATLAQNIIIAAFIPLVVYMASAVGTQMAAFIIRDLAINPTFNFIKYFTKQLIVVFLIAVLSSSFFLLLNFFLYHDYALSLVLGIAMFVAIMSSIITGLVVPYFLNKLKFDPANASGPLGTILQDILTVLIYFIVASVML